MTPEAAPETGERAGNQAGAGSPTPMPKLTICPYCGARSRGLASCENCRGRFDPLSRQATQNAMGPWYIRDGANPHRPGCSYETLVRLVSRGSVTGETVIRGPSSRQFWTLARWCPGVAHLMGVCHSCQRAVDPVSSSCESCGASFRIAGDRQVLGLGEVRFVPGRDQPEGGQFADAPDAGVRAPASGAAAGGAPAGRGAGSGEGAGVDAGAGAGVGVGIGAVDPRVVRLERDLRSARRWRALWCVGACVMVVGVVAVLVGRRLDLGDGPVGRWLGARAAEPAPGRLSAGADAPTPIAAPRVGRSVPAGEAEESPGLPGVPGERAGATPDARAVPPGEAPGADASGEGGGEAAASGPVDPRLETLARLRRLR